MEQHQDNSITVIVPGFRRPNNMQSIVDAVGKQTVPVQEIILWYNESGVDLPSIEGVKIIYANYNFKYYAKFAVALLARTKYICLLDDDMAPGPNWMEYCLECMNKKEGIYGGSGMVYNGLFYDSITVNQLACKEITPVDYVGGSWFFKREWLKYFWFEDPASYDNAEDIHFGYICKKYGGINSYIAPQKEDSNYHPNIIPNLGNDSVASYKNNPVEYLDVRENVAWEYAMNRGWNPINGRPWVKVQDLRNVGFQVWQELFMYNVYNLVPWDIAGANVIDIGANVGMFSLVAAAYGAKRILAIEAQATTFGILKQFTQYAPMIEPEHYAVLDRPRGTAFIPNDGPAAQIGDLGEPVETIGLTELLNQLPPDDNNIVLKIDCEGSEYDIILHSEDSIWKRFKRIYLEIHGKMHPYYKGYDVVLQKLESLGFTCVHSYTWWDESGGVVDVLVTMWIRR